MHPRFFGCCCTVVLVFCACSSSKKTGQSGGRIVVNSTPAAAAVRPKSYDSLQTKYAAYLKIEPDQVTNMKLYRFIDKWLNTPYKWGGTTKKGVDCSSLIQQLLQNVYDISIPRTSVEQFYAKWINKFTSTKHLSEGDLVFFSIDDTKVISHVGLYLNNRMFINASSSRGVSIANLDDPYWRRVYAGAGRVNLALLPGHKK
jgi:murein DD-endopeptidase / murein LD-carboxypeptidase